jgi:hypothetical protein
VTQHRVEEHDYGGVDMQELPGGTEYPHGVDYYDATFTTDLQFALEVHRALAELDEQDEEEDE